MRRPLLLSAGLWWAGLALGHWCAAAVPGDFNGFAAATPPGLSWTTLCLNNLVVVALAALGRVAWGIPTIVVLLNSGIALGLVSGVVPLSRLEVLGLTLPYCSLEVPALWLAGAVGLSRGRPIRVGRVLVVSVALTVAGAVVEGEFTLERSSNQPPGRSVAAGSGGGSHLRLDVGDIASGWTRLVGSGG